MCPTDVVGPCRSDDLGAEEVDLGGAAGARGAAHRDDRHGGLDEVLGERREQRQQRGRRVAAGDGDALGGAKRLPATRELGQAVGPATRVGRAIEPLPRRRIGEPEVGAAVHDQRVGPELLGQCRGMPVRQGEEHHVVPGQHVDVGRLEHPVGQRE